MRPTASRMAVAAGVEVVDVAPEGSPTAMVVSKKPGYFDDEGWSSTLGMVPPDDVRDRLGHTMAMLGKQQLAYMGDTVWEYLVLKHQYKQVVRSPYTESQAVRNQKQAKAAKVLWQSGLLTEKEQQVLKFGTSFSWKKKVKTNFSAVEEVGWEQYSAAIGLRALLGFIYLDKLSSDDRLEVMAREIGIFAEPGEEDRLLSEVTEGQWQPGDRGNQMFFLALAPLGHVALRLYISRYFFQRPLRDDEFIYRVKLALREEELDVASAGFMRDYATEEELKLMRSARDQNDTYAFAFECLLGHLALTKPYRLHQIVADFGWAVPLPGT